MAGVGTGLIANYFSDQELQNLALTRVDSSVDFDWGEDSPGANVPADNFSARWTGKIQAQFDESYTFYTQSDEGVALWVNGQQIIDNFADHTFGEDSGTITLKAGELYDIRVDYYDNQFDAAMRLLWSSPSTPKAVVPQTQLYSDAGWTSGPGGAWLNTDVGSPSTAGSVSSLGKTYNLDGAGGGTGSTSDQFQYLYQTLNGDGVLVAQVSATQGSAGGAEAGVIIRESLAGNAKFVAVNVNASGVGSFESRSSTGASATNAGGSTGKYWVKLVRDGNYFRGYTSSNGADGSWTYFGSTTVAMSRTVYAGVAAAGGTGGSVNHAQFKNVSLVANVPLGAGLDQVRDWSAGAIFVDAARSARTPQGPNLGPAVNFDANGWPTQDFMTIFVSGFTGTAHLYNGTYKGSFTGQADVNRWITPGGQILNKVYNAATNTTTFDLVVNASETQDQWYVGANFLNTRRDANAPLNSGITNLKLIRPGYDPNTTQVFRAEYLDHLKQFSVLRFMDWTSTNDNTVVNWSDRTKVTDARQSGNKGVAWEYVVQLANLLDKDVWVNIPANANDDYVANLAQLLKDNLEPDRVVYVEYSNEVWNGIFEQNSENQAAAIAEVNAGGSPLNADGSTNSVYWAWRRVGKRIKEIGDTFAGVWGQSAINARVRPVLAGQHANSEVLKQGIEFIERTYGAPGNFIYGIATAPYFAFSDTFDSVSRTPTELLNALQSSVNGLANKYYQHDTFARRYGLANITYEGGSHIDGANNLTSKKLAQLDPRMRDIVTSYLNGWYAQGGGLFNWFVAGPTIWNDKGMWGLSNAIDNYTAPKALGTQDVAGAARTSLSFGIPIPGSFDARAVAGATLPYSNTYLKDPNAGNSFDYFIRAPRAGRYRITLSAATAGSNEQLRLAVNGATVRTHTLKNTGNSTSFQSNVLGTFDLVEGMNLLHFTSIKDTTWNIQAVTVDAAPAAASPPTVVTPAGASAVSSSGKTVDLSVLGADNGGESSLLYSWEAIDEQPMSVVFSVNGTNAAKNTTATFTRAGTFQLRATISDGLATATSTVSVTIDQNLTSISVAPTGTAVANNETRQLAAAAKDQFGNNFMVQPTFVWSVDNGLGTVDQNGLYSAPASGVGTAVVRATALGISGTATVQTQLPRVPDNPAHLVTQIDYSYYEGTWTNLPDFATLTPIKSGLVNNISLTPKNRSDNFAFKYTGYVFVPASGTYTFYTTSDDGSKLWVGGQQVVDNDGTHGSRERSGTIILDTGWHAFTLGYFEATGGESVSMSFNGPGLSGKTVIPDGNVKRVDRAPTIATAPSANPNPVIGKTADLNVIGDDETGEGSLTYTWSTVTAPAGAPTPTFGVNGTNAAKNSLVTFSRAGNYVLQVSISDGTLATTATVNVVVDQTIATITLSPASPTVKQNRNQQFAAVAKDQFGNVVSNPTLTWSAPPNGGTITSSGLYTAPDTLGQYIVTASAGAVSGSATVTVIEDAAPTLAAPASANPSSTSGSSTQLSVLGADDGGESNLTYTWAATTIPAGAAQPTFSVNGNNNAKQAWASLSAPGTYTFQVTISDGFKSVTSGVDVTVTSNAPTVAQAAAATPNPGTGTTSSLSVLGADGSVGEAGLTYTWATTGTPPAPVSFSANGTNAAKSSTATFMQAGAYAFAVTISNGAQSVTSSVNVTVNQQLSSLSVSPVTTNVTQGGTRQFVAMAKDQFGAALATQPASITWGVNAPGAPNGSSGSGTISTAGLYTAPAAGTPTDTVYATASGVNGSASVTVTPVTPPPGGDAFGQSADIGSPGLAGSYSRAGSTYIVKGGGADIWGTSDQFHYVYRTLVGDGQIVARVVSVQNTHTAAKAGVMFRESLAANARHADLVISPDNITRFQPRMTNGGSTVSYPLTGSTPPYWLKLVRSGNMIAGYRSPDGVTWTQVEDQTYTSLPSTMYVGLSVTARDNTKLNTSSFDNVSVTQGAGLASAATAVATASRTIAPAHLVPAAAIARDVLQITQVDVTGKKPEATLL